MTARSDAVARRSLALLALIAATAAASPQAQPPAAQPPAVQPPAAKPAAGQPAPDQPATATAGLSAGSGPIDITSDESLELQQSNKVYIARGNAVAKRGDRTVYADVLMAYYRNLPNSSQTEIWRVAADGHVKITTPTQNVVGDHGVYDLDTKTAVVTGGDLKLTTPQDVVTARDSLEWYDDKQMAVARGDAVAVRGDRRVRGDLLQAQVATSPGQASRISRVDANGHVLVSGPDQVGTGDTGVYNLDTGIATLVGHVTLARGQNTLVGQYGVVDLQRGVSRLLPRPPTAADTTRGRVQGYIVPQKRNGADKAKPGAAPAAPPAAGGPAPAEKARTNGAEAR